MITYDTASKCACLPRFEDGAIPFDAASLQRWKDIHQRSFPLPRHIESIDHWARVIIFGNTTPVVTIAKGDGRLYLEAIPGYVAHLKRVECGAILSMGATGQWKVWRDNDRRLEYNFAMAKAAKVAGMIVHVHATGNSVEETLCNITGYSKDPNVDVVILAPGLLGQNEKTALITALVGGNYSKKPIGFYDNPAYCDGVALEFEDFERAAGLICVAKNSTSKAKSVRVQALLGRLYGFFLTQGDETAILPYLASGGLMPRDDRIRGSVASHGNLLPTVGKIFRADTQAEALRLQQEVTNDVPLYTCDRKKAPQGITWLLQQMGVIPEDAVILGERFNTEELLGLRRWL